MHDEEWKIDSKAIQGLATSMTFLAFQNYGNAGNITFNVKISPPATRRETLHLVDFFGF